MSSVAIYLQTEWSIFWEESLGGLQCGAADILDCISYKLRCVQQFHQDLQHTSIFRLEHPVDLTVRQDPCSSKQNVLWNII